MEIIKGNSTEKKDILTENIDMLMKEVIRGNNIVMNDDTLTVNGILELHHFQTALEQAARWLDNLRAARDKNKNKDFTIEPYIKK
jgi:hypothetical protein